MDLTHLHLLIVHLPIYGSLLGSFVLLYAMVTKSKSTKLAALYVLTISSIGGFIAYSTGEAAEDTVENIQGINEAMIETHEAFAKFALASVITLGGLSLTGIYLHFRKSSLSKAVSTIVLIASLFCIGISSWTGYLGGKIRHSEVARDAKLAPAVNSH